MTKPANPLIDAVLAELTELEKTMGATRRKIAGGERIDLSGLAARTQKFCEKVVAIEPELRIGFSHRMGALATDMDLLKEQLVYEQAKLQAAR
ncbi:MAG: hypothetical protein FJX61_14760 [Alphaproteobacteria bacterium]|nr:hypothetical protein [Alphaproteobacteria bacterium]